MFVPFIYWVKGPENITVPVPGLSTPEFIFPPKVKIPLPKKVTKLLLFPISISPATLIFPLVTLRIDFLKVLPVPSITIFFADKVPFKTLKVLLEVLLTVPAFMVNAFVTVKLLVDVI